ncbi:SDR family NAD(P)-dependent oxidoreductase [Paraburkholderia sp. J67]|uniref:SDR family NAD(P)-dependent oxidoreductase n=1 Tax=Paraburkholderia sp. J67 TaxID=2805435 RepID=UPI002ABE3441|nr:SDR family oxidoreductase [Paraburkholderia sp. J67]
MPQLSGKTALVTDAARGVGRLIAVTLAQEGAQVLAHCAAGAADAQATVDEIRAAGGKAQPLSANLREADGVHRLARRVRSVVGARLDILVMGAGCLEAAPDETRAPADFDDSITAHVRAPWLLVQQLLPAMCKGSSVVLLLPHEVSGTAGTLTVLAAHRGALTALVRHFAAECGARGIRVNGLTPGEPAGDVARAVTFLASDAARAITGASLNPESRSASANGFPTGFPLPI